MFKYIYIFFFVSTLNFLEAQTKLSAFLQPSDTLNISRRNTVLITEGAIATIAIVGLNTLWYSDYPQSKFHTINDGNEWLQMDKIGHAYSAYQLSRLTSEALQWSGAKQKQQLIYGAAASFSFLTAVEVMDGYSKEWGFSWPDMLANTAGTSLFVSQELLWQEQRILLKYSFHQTKFAKLRADKLGKGIIEEALKDYNGQTYWISFNLKSFFKTSKIPNWLNLAVGYGANGMLTGEKETMNLMYSNQKRIRQFYMSFDVDLTKIKTNSNFLKTFFSILNVIKVPFPTFELTLNRKPKIYWLYF